VASNVSVIIKSTGSATVVKEITDLGDAGERTGSRIEQMGKAIQGLTLDELGQKASRAGNAIEELAKSQQELNTQVGQTAAAMGVSEGSFRDLAVEIANAGFPLKEVVPLMKMASQEGLSGQQAIGDYASFWDDVADATGSSAVALAEGATGLRAVGIAAGQESDALSAFGFVTDHTKLSIDDFLGLLERKGANLHKFGISIDDTAAILGIMEKTLGLTGKAAASEFASALDKSDGSMTSLLATLGITNDEFDAMRRLVDESSGVIERNAAIQDSNITSTERWKEKLGELLFVHSDLVQGLSEAAPYLIAVGPILEGIAAGFEIASVATGLMAGSTVAHEAATVTDTVALGANAAAQTAAGTAAAVAAPEIAAAGAAMGVEATAASAGAVALEGVAVAEGVAAAAAVESAAAFSLSGLALGALPEIAAAATVAFFALGGANQDTNMVVRDGALVFADSGRAAEDAESAWRRAAIAAGMNRDAVLAMSDAEIQWHIEAGKTVELLKAEEIAAGGAAKSNEELMAAAQRHAEAEAYNEAAIQRTIAAMNAVPAAASRAAAGFAGMISAAKGAMESGFNVREMQAGIDPLGIAAFQRSISGLKDGIIKSVGSAFDDIATGGGGGVGGSAAAAGKTVSQTFMQAMAQGLAGQEMATEFGAAGARVLEAFGAALQDPSRQASIAPAIISLIDQAKAQGVPNADALGKALIDAVAAGLASGNWDGVYAAMHDLADSLSPAAIKIKADTDAITKAFTDMQTKLGEAADKEKKDLAALEKAHTDNVARIEKAHKDAQDRILKSKAKNMAEQLATENEHYQDSKDAEDKAYGERIKSRQTQYDEQVAALKAAYEKLRTTQNEEIIKLGGEAVEAMGKAGKDAAAAFDAGMNEPAPSTGSRANGAGGSGGYTGALPGGFGGAPAHPYDPATGQSIIDFSRPYHIDPVSGVPVQDPSPSGSGGSGTTAGGGITINIDTVNAATPAAASQAAGNIGFALAARGWARV